MPKPRFRAKSGFTLLELLVVVAIISLLSALLFPVFGRARENARRTSCSSNIKQLSVALLLYTQDYDETFVPTSLEFYEPSNQPPYEKPRGWADALYPYTKTIEVNQCPSESRPPSSNPAAGLNGGMTGPAFMDYGYNGMIGNELGLLPTSDLNTRKQPGIKLSVLAAPSLTVMVFDSVGTNAVHGASMGRGYGTKYSDCRNELARISEATTPVSDPCPFNEGRHLGGNNVGFADGHAKWFKSNPLVFGHNFGSSVRVWSIQSSRLWDAKHGTKWGDATFAINEEGTIPPP